MSHGNFIYGESKYNGFALVHVTGKKIDVKLLGVEFFKGLPPKPAPAPTPEPSTNTTKPSKKKSKKHHKKAAKPHALLHSSDHLDAPVQAPVNKIAFDPNAYTVSLMNLRHSMLNDYGFGKDNIDNEYNSVYQDYRSLNDEIIRDLPQYNPEEEDGKADIFAKDE
jgi:hypothetical protein